MKQYYRVSTSQSVTPINNHTVCYQPQHPNTSAPQHFRTPKSPSPLTYITISTRHKQQIVVSSISKNCRSTFGQQNLINMPSTKENLIALDMRTSIWNQFFTIAPLIVVGSKEGDVYDLAPKHMATPLGLDNFFGFVCTPRHATYHNIKKEGFFTVSFPKPDEVVFASLAASPRYTGDGKQKNIITNLPTFPATKGDAPFLEQAYLFFECEHFKTVDGFGQHSLICGKIIAAYVDEAYLRVSEQDEQEMVFNAPLLAYLAHGRFAKVQQTLAFPFPKNFKN